MSPAELALPSKVFGNDPFMKDSPLRIRRRMEQVKGMNVSEKCRFDSLLRVRRNLHLESSELRTPKSERMLPPSLNRQIPGETGFQIECGNRHVRHDAHSARKAHFPGSSINHRHGTPDLVDPSEDVAWPLGDGAFSALSGC